MENNGYVAHSPKTGNDALNVSGKGLTPQPDSVVGRSRLVIHEDEYGHQRSVTLIFLRDGQVRWEKPRNPGGFPELPIEEYFPPYTPRNF